MPPTGAKEKSKNDSASGAAKTLIL